MTIIINNERGRPVTAPAGVVYGGEIATMQ